MSEAFMLRILSPDRMAYEEPVRYATLTAVTGAITIFPDHAPIFLLLAPGDIAFFDGTQMHTISIPGGVAEFSKNEMTVLANSLVEPA